MRRLALLLVLLAARPAIAAEEPVLNIYNWADYTSPAMIAEFEKTTGIKVNYDTYDSNNAMEAKLVAGGTGYDIVTTSTSYFGRQIKAGLYQPLDKSKLTNWKNLDPRILKVQAEFDPDNAHAVPYMHGVDGFAYNAELIGQRMKDAPVDSLDMVFKPEIAAKFADCGISFIDSPIDVVQLALAYLHLDPNSHKPADYQAVEQLFKPIRPFIRAFDSSEYPNRLVNKEICIAIAWSGDAQHAVAVANAAGAKLDVRFTVPKEGAAEWYDALLIPKAAPHPENAHRFLNFILDARVIASITNTIHTANDNLAANALVDPSILNDPGLYPTQEMFPRLYHTTARDADSERLLTRAWTRIKTGR
jgi:putrescine transport system substrate-binding protein